MLRTSSLLFFACCMGIFSFFSSCKPKPQFAPTAPAETYDPLQTVVQQQLSAINIPVEVPLAEIQKALNAQLQGLLYEDNSLEDNNKDNVMIKVWKREDVRLEAGGNLIGIRVPIRVWAKVRYGFDRFGIRIYDVRETDFEMDVKFVSQIAVTPEWQVQTKTSPAGFDWVRKPFVKFGPIEIPVAPTVGRIIDGQQESLAARLDDQVRNELPIRKYVDQAWTLMQTPVQVSEAYQTWLKVTPTEVLITPLVAREGKVRALVGIKGYTETIIGRKPEPGSTALPPLQVTDSIPDEFSVGISGEISHAYATQLVSKQFVNQKFGSGGYEVTVTSVDLYGNGDHLIVKAGLVGSVNGTVYLRGKPYYDPASQTVSLQNLEYDLDTRNKLLQTANWLLKGTFLRRLSEAFKVPVGPQMAEAKKNLQEKLNNNQIVKGIYLNGRIDELVPSSVVITPDAIFAVVLAKGKVDVKIAGLL